MLDFIFSMEWGNLVGGGDMNRGIIWWLRDFGVFYIFIVRFLNSVWYILIFNY